MESIINNRMCRCCASEGTFKDVKTLYYWMGVEEVYADMLRECFDIDLTCVEAGEHGGICEVCITQLRNASNFKKQVLQTEDHFKKFLESSDKFFKTKIIKEEGVSKYDNLEDDDVGAPVLDSDNGSDDYPLADLEIKQEYKDELKTRKRTAKAGSSKAKKSKKDGESTSKQPVPRRSIITIKADDIKSNQEITEQKKDCTKCSNNEQKQQQKIKLKRQTESHKHIHNALLIMTATNATPVQCKDSIGYKCCFCPIQFPALHNLKTHTIDNHKNVNQFMRNVPMSHLIIKLDITDLKCNICDQKYGDLEAMICHLTQEHGKKFHDDLKNHIISFKNINDEIQCGICSDGFRSFKIMLEHMNMHFPNHVCEICGGGFINKKILQSHASRHITGQFPCSQCNKIYNTRVKKRDHENAIHKNKNMRNKCGYCEEKFSDYTKKHKHEVKMHGVEPTVLHCRGCDKTFDNQRSLTVHTKYHHGFF